MLHTLLHSPRTYEPAARSIECLADRAEALEALDCIDLVMGMGTPTEEAVDALEFAAIAAVRLVRPDLDLAEATLRIQAFCDDLIAEVAA